MIKEIKGKKYIKKILLTLGIIFTITILFLGGYSLGYRRTNATIMRNILPNFITDVKYNDTEIITKTFILKSDFEGEDVSIPNIITYPHSWYFDEIELRNGNKKYIITSSNGEITLTISPRRIDNARSIMSVTTVLNQEITRRCLGSYDISSSSEVEFISLYRENIDNENIIYVQEVAAAADPQEKPLALEEFFVYKRDGGFLNTDEYIWTADISLKFDNSVPNEQKEWYLKIVDEIVSSLQIK